MTTMDDLAAFISARLSEDEAMAKAAQPGPWSIETWEGMGGTYASVMVPFGPAAPNAKTGLTSMAKLGTQDAETAAHIARHDPARVLREVAAKRAMVTLHEHYPATTKNKGGPDFGCGLCHEERDYGIIGYGWCGTIRHLAAIWSDHPDYRPEWAPGPSPSTSS